MKKVPFFLYCRQLGRLHPALDHQVQMFTFFCTPNAFQTEYLGRAKGKRRTEWV